MSKNLANPEVGFVCLLQAMPSFFTKKKSVFQSIEGVSDLQLSDHHESAIQGIWSIFDAVSLPLIVQPIQNVVLQFWWVKV